MLDLLEELVSSRYYLDTESAAKLQGYDSMKSVSNTIRVGGRATYDVKHTWDVVADASGRLRKLTPRECWRLMGVTDEEFNRLSGISNKQLYKLAGNSIVINVLVEIFKPLLEIINARK